MKKLLLLTAIIACAPYLLAQEEEDVSVPQKKIYTPPENEEEEDYNFDEVAPEPEPWPPNTSGEVEKNSEETAPVAPVVGLEESKEEDEVAPEPEPAPEPKEPSKEDEDEESSITHSFSIGGFYGFALQDLYDEIDKVDIYGAKIAYDFPAFDASERLSVAPFVEVMFGYGDVSDTVLAGTYVIQGTGDSVMPSFNNSYSDVKITLMRYDVALGLRWRFECTENFALTSNVKFGVDIESMEIKEKNDYYGNYKENATAVGFLWGAGIAAEFGTKHFRLFVGADYVGSTAKPDFDEYTEPDAQSYVVASAGIIIRF